MKLTTTFSLLFCLIPFTLQAQDVDSIFVSSLAKVITNDQPTEVNITINLPQGERASQEAKPTTKRQPEPVQTKSSKPVQSVPRPASIKPTRIKELQTSLANFAQSNCPGGVCPTTPTASRSDWITKPNWTWPGNLATHMASTHGVDVSGMSYSDMRDYHDHLHNSKTGRRTTVQSYCPSGNCPTDYRTNKTQSVRSVGPVRRFFRRLRR